MRILYAIQGTGNGHLSRARDIIPVLQQNHDVDILISGSQADVELPYPITYKCRGLGFVFGKKGGIDVVETCRKSNLKAFINEIVTLPVAKYDLVINDFEPVAAWACYRKNKKCIALSHQAAVLNRHVPQPKKADLVGSAILKNYAPASSHYGFHFKEYDSHIYTPVIRKQVRDQTIQNNGHYTVYLPAYDDDQILKVLTRFKDVQWQVFSKHNKQVIKKKNLIIQPVNNEAFIASMASAEGILCGAGFETPAEALFMNKKLMVVPMKNQYEQQCNAAALKDMGVPVIKSFKTKHTDKIEQWLGSNDRIPVIYPDNTALILNRIIEEEASEDRHHALLPEKKIDTPKKLRNLLFDKLVKQW